MAFDADKERSFLNGLAEGYKDDSRYSRVKKEIIVETFGSFFKELGKGKGLQLGCASGYETQLLSEKLDSLTVVDGASDFLQVVKSRSELSNVFFIDSLFEDFDSGSHVGRYDYIFCSYILEHVVEPGRILKNLAGLLAEGGVVFVVVPNCHALSRQIALEMGLMSDLKDLSENDLRHGHRRVYCVDSLLADIEGAGFSVEHVRGVVLKILADFQLNKLLSDGMLTDDHIRAMHKLSQDTDNLRFSDSILVVARV